MTAWNAVLGRLPVGPGSTVVVIGSVGVALFALQIATAVGARVVATGRRDEQGERLRALSATDFVNSTVMEAWTATRCSPASWSSGGSRSAATACTATSSPSSSVGIVFDQPQTALYTATKAAIAGLTRVLSLELAPRGIGTNAITARLVDTEGTRASGFIGSEAEAEVVAQTPLGRLGTPQDMVPLSSDASRSITGGVLYASGGQF